MDENRRYNLLQQFDEDWSEGIAENVDLAGLIIAIVASDKLLVEGWTLTVTICLA
jgi:hypothetical protein